MKKEMNQKAEGGAQRAGYCNEQVGDIMRSYNAFSACVQENLGHTSITSASAWHARLVGNNN